jgi:hypothetical protein
MREDRLRKSSNLIDRAEEEGKLKTLALLDEVIRHKKAILEKPQRVGSL